MTLLLVSILIILRYEIWTFLNWINSRLQKWWSYTWIRSLREIIICINSFRFDNLNIISFVLDHVWINLRSAWAMILIISFNIALLLILSILFRWIPNKQLRIYRIFLVFFNKQLIQLWISLLCKHKMLVLFVLNQLFANLTNLIRWIEFQTHFWFAILN